MELQVRRPPASVLNAGRTSFARSQAPEAQKSHEVNEVRAQPRGNSTESSRLTSTSPALVAMALALGVPQAACRVYLWLSWKGALGGLHPSCGRPADGTGPDCTTRQGAGCGLSHFGFFLALNISGRSWLRAASCGSSWMTTSTPGCASVARPLHVCMWCQAVKSPFG